MAINEDGNLQVINSLDGTSLEHQVAILLVVLHLYTKLAHFFRVDFFGIDPLIVVHAPLSETEL